MVDWIKNFLYIRHRSTDSRTKAVVKGAFFMLVSSMLGNLIRLGLIIGLTRYFTKEEFGVWATITSVAAVFAYGDFGITNALRNKLSQIKDTGNDGIRKARSYFYSSFLFSVVIGILISMFILAASRVVSFNFLFKTNNILLKQQGINILLWIQFLIFLNIPFSMGIACFFSFNESRYSAIFLFLQSISSSLVVLILALFNNGIHSIIVGYFSTITVINGVGTLYFLKLRGWLGHIFSLREFMSDTKELISLGIKFMGYQFSYSFVQNAGTILASSLLGLGMAAEFNIVQKLYGFLSSIYQSIFNPIWGGYAEADTRNDWIWCKRTLSGSIFISSGIFIAAIAILLIFGQYLLFIVAGANYNYDRILFLLLGFTSLFSILFSTGSTYLSATNRIELLLISMIVTSIVIIPFSRFLVGQMGITGIALATSVIWFVLMNIVTYKSYTIIGNKIRYTGKFNPL